jgi:hypothetical protein
MDTYNYNMAISWHARYQNSYDESRIIALVSCRLYELQRLPDAKSMNKTVSFRPFDHAYALPESRKNLK